MTLRQRLIFTVGVVSLVSAAIFAGSLYYLVSTTLGLSENRAIERGIQVAIQASSSPDEREDAMRAFRAYRQLRVVRGLIEQRTPLAGLLFGLVVFGLSLGISSVVLLRLTRPLNQLTSALHRAGQGDLDVKVRGPSNNELGAAAEAFNTMAARLRRLQEELKRSERLAAWRDVARILGHEIRNPLTPIRLSIERLRAKSERQSPDLNDVIERSTTTVLDEIGVLDRLAREFSQFARMPVPAPEPTDVNALLAEVAASYTGAQTAVRLETDLDPAVGRWRLDPGMMRQVFGNVLRNATEALRRSNGGRMRVQTRREEDTLRLVFEDDGPGVPAELRDRIFEPYVTTKTKGTGLGLAVVRSIIEQHRGTVRFEPTTAGAKLVILLPQGVTNENQDPHS